MARTRNGSVASRNLASVMSEVQSALSMPGRVIALCGPPGSGKGVVAGRAAARGMTVLSLGDVVRAEIADRGLPETPENVGQTALSMREEQGETIVVDRLMPSLSEAMESSDVLVDGMRQTEELERLREHIEDVTIVALTASAQARAGWLAERGRGEDGGDEEFAVREEREWNWGLEHLMTQAHAIILNEGSVEELAERTDMILETLGF